MNTRVEKADFIIIEKAKFKDVKEISSLALDAFQHHSNLDPLLKSKSNRKSLSITIKTYEKWIKSRNFQFFVAKDNGLIVGVIIGEIQKEDPIYVRKKKGIVHSLFLEKKILRKGIANKLYIVNKLFNKLSSWFKEKKIGHVEIYLHAKNSPAIKTWKKIGFSTDVHRMRKAI